MVAGISARGLVGTQLGTDRIGCLYVKMGKSQPKIADLLLFVGMTIFSDQYFDGNSSPLT